MAHVKQYGKKIIKTELGLPLTYAASITLLDAAKSYLTNHFVSKSTLIDNALIGLSYGLLLSGILNIRELKDTRLFRTEFQPVNQATAQHPPISINECTYPSTNIQYGTISYAKRILSGDLVAN